MYKVFINDSQIIFTSSAENSMIPSMGNLLEHPLQIMREIACLDEAKQLIFSSDTPSESFRVFLKAFNLVEAAGGVVRNENGEVLLIKRLGKWDLPKGKIEPGEAKDEAAVREVMEECAIPRPQLKESLPTTYHYYEQAEKPIIKPTYWYAMEVEGKPNVKPQEEEGITEVVWADRAMLKIAVQDTYASLKDLMETAIA